MKKRSKPIEWIEESSPQEIGEALLAADPSKAYAVVSYLASRIGPELGAKIQKAQEQIEENPLRAIGRAIRAISGD